MKLAFDPHLASTAKPGEGGKALKTDEQAELKKLCQDFEAVFIQTMFKQMRAAIPEDGYLDTGMGGELFQEMMDTEVAREMARKGGFGLGRLLYESFAKDSGYGRNNR
jgi:flagellar protein FlgJ